MLILTVAAAAYLIGSLNGAIILGKILKWPDVRQSGSGNPGATNIGRIAGTKAAILVGLFDLFKGVCAVWLALAAQLSEPLVLASGIIAVLGHMYPIFHQFKGGKGVATTFGMLITYQTSLALPLIVSWLVVVAVTQYVSLASLLAVLSVLIIKLWHHDFTISLLMGLLLAMVTYRHKTNLIRLIAHQENKFNLIKFIQAKITKTSDQSASEDTPQETEQKDD